MPTLRNKLAQFCSERGAVAFGITRLTALRTDDFLLPAATIERMPTAVSIALPLLPAVLTTLDRAPNALYEHHYRQTNFALDRLALDLCRWLDSQNAQALAIPASQIVDWEGQRGHLSHKRVAIAAGLGWLGRNNLVVTTHHGAQVRLVTVLTDLEMDTDQPLDQDCGSCRQCISACPCRAIGDTPAEFRHHACFAQLREFQRRRLTNQYICGLCVAVCSGRGYRL